MNRIFDIIFMQDLFKLTKSTLKDLATELNIDSSLTKNELVIKIFAEKDNLSAETITKIESKILATKSTSVTWYRIDKIFSAEDFRNKLKKNSKIDPFTTIGTIKENDITTTPKLISASSSAYKHGIFLRYVYKSGVRYEQTLTSIKTIAKTSISTVYYDADNGIIEIRGDTRKAEDVVKQIANSIDNNITFTLIEQPFTQEMGDIADKLNGQLTEATSKPEFYFEEFSDDDSKAIVDVLKALDDYIENKDSSSLENALQNASDVFQQGDLITPFATLILSGMETVGMAGTNEIRTLPLFSYLHPYLQHQGGFIKFAYTDGHIEQNYTIRIGINTKSIVFMSQVSESLIDYVRTNVII